MVLLKHCVYKCTFCIFAVVYVLAYFLYRKHLTHNGNVLLPDLHTILLLHSITYLYQRYGKNGYHITAIFFPKHRAV